MNELFMVHGQDHSICFIPCPELTKALLISKDLAMSRCFPFPKTGYEKKARSDEVDFLKKEKQKEKKHKKDKRDKDKKEGKEKRTKEGRDGKHKDKKDKKEKHKGKKKDKEKDKSRDKDKEFPAHSEGINAGKLDHQDYKQNNKKGSKQYSGINNGQKARENNHMVDENKDSRFLLELDRRIRDVDARVVNQLVQKFGNSDHRKDESTVNLVVKQPDANEKLMDKGLDARKIDGKEMWVDIQSIGNAPIGNNAGNFYPKLDGISRLLGKYSDRNLEEKDKIMEKNEEREERVKEKKDEREEKIKEKKDERKQKTKEKKDDNRKHKKKDREKKKKGHGKDKDRDKEKKKEEKKEEKVEELRELKTMQDNKIGPIDSNSFPPSYKNNHEIVVNGENIKKRKDIESNGAPCANDNWPNKFPRSSPSLPKTQNGRTLETCQISIPDASNKSRIVNNVNDKVETRECKINGIVEAQPLTVASHKTCTDIDSMSTDPIIEASTKPPRSPHPDTKYLNEVCSVPTVEQLSDFNDQEWLFGPSLSQKRKPEVESLEIGETSFVWAEALPIESVDVFALPYVIPY